MKINTQIKPYIATSLVLLLAFLYVFVYFSNKAKHTRIEKLYYPTHQATKEAKNKEAQNNISLTLQNHRLEDGLYKNSIKIYCGENLKIEKISQFALDLLHSDQDGILSAKLVFFPQRHSKNKVIFSATSASISSKTKGHIILEKENTITNIENDNSYVAELVVIKMDAGPILLNVKRSGLQPDSEYLWTIMDDSNTNGKDHHYAIIKGWFRYSAEGIPIYTRAQLLSHAWGFGVDQDRIVYLIVAVAFCSSTLGFALIFFGRLLHKTHIVFICSNALGCSAMFFALGIMQAIIFPPFRGPDEVHHFRGYAETTNQKKLIPAFIHLANVGSFKRIHRNKDEKIASIDSKLENNFELPADTMGEYIVNRSPLGLLLWSLASQVFSDMHAGRSMLELRIFNCVLVSACMFIALCAAGSLTFAKEATPWLACPFLIIPCIAHYATMISNYPFLIGGYVIQVVVFGILWFSLLSKHTPNIREDCQIGMLLGLGNGISISSGDNGLAALVFWAVIIPAYFAAESLKKTSAKTKIKNILAFYASFFIVLTLFCGVVAHFSVTKTFLPEKASVFLTNHLPVCGNPFAAGLLFLSIYLITLICISFLSIWTTREIIKSLTRRSPHLPTKVALVILFSIISLFILIKFRIPEINLSRGIETSMLGYAFCVLTAFIDGFFPGNPDPILSFSFWTKLGWLDTDLPRISMEILRISIGIGIILLSWHSFVESRFYDVKIFCIASIIGILVCIAAIACLYFMVLYNVRGRYTMIVYLLTAGLSVQGLRLYLLRITPLYNKHKILIFWIPCSIIVIQTACWIAILDRHF